MKTTIDNAAAYELKLYTDNNSNVYFSSLVPVYKNLDKKMEKGIFDSKKAVVAFSYVTEYAAKLYCKEFGGLWYVVFNKATREQAARELLEDYITEHNNGNILY